jgi:hypothetical protein
VLDDGFRQSDARVTRLGLRQTLFVYLDRDSLISLCDRLYGGLTASRPADGED